jgi:hypothetical protein
MSKHTTGQIRWARKSEFAINWSSYGLSGTEKRTHEPDKSKAKIRRRRFASMGFTPEAQLYQNPSYSGFFWALSHY